MVYRLDLSDCRELTHLPVAKTSSPLGQVETSDPAHRLRLKNPDHADSFVVHSPDEVFEFISSGISRPLSQ